MTEKATCQKHSVSCRQNTPMQNLAKTLGQHAAFGAGLANTNTKAVHHKNKRIGRFCGLFVSCTVTPAKAPQWERGKAAGPGKTHDANLAHLPWSRADSSSRIHETSQTTSVANAGSHDLLFISTCFPHSCSCTQQKIWRRPAHVSTGLQNGGPLETGRHAPQKLPLSSECSYQSRSCRLAQSVLTNPRVWGGQHAPLHASRC